MKKILFLACFMMLAQFAMAQVTEAIFNNTTKVYYVGTFHTTSISGCASSALSTFYHDIPDETLSDQDALDENGDQISSVSDVTGITVATYTYPPGTTGTPHYIDFCSGVSGFTSIPEANGYGPTFTIITWYINTANNEVTVNFY